MLAELGQPEALDRLHAPAGLDIGAEGPEEVARAIVAEILAVTRGRAGGSLRDRRGPIQRGVVRPMNEILMRLVAESLAFLELTDADVIDPDVAVRQLESITDSLQKLSRTIATHSSGSWTT